MTASLIERAAEALCQDITGKPYSGMSRIGQQMMRRHARAMLGAMREPTEAMLVTGARKRTDPMRNFGEDDTLLPEWQAMIDAALEEGR